MDTTDTGRLVSRNPLSTRALPPAEQLVEVRERRRLPLPSVDVGPSPSVDVGSATAELARDVRSLLGGVDATGCRGEPVGGLGVDLIEAVLSQHLLLLRVPAD